MRLFSIITSQFMYRFKGVRISFISLVILSFPIFLHAQSAMVTQQQNLSDTQGGLSGPGWFTDFDPFSYPTASELGTSIADIGDFDGDGISDLLVGSEGNSDGGARRGAVHILYMNADGTVKEEDKISSLIGRESIINLPIGGLPFNNFDHAGSSVTSLGDINSDGVTDLAIGARGDGLNSKGAVYILRMRANGIIDNYTKIREGEGGFSGTFDNLDGFGFAMTSLGDIDGDGITDIAVGTRSGNGGGNDRGEVWILFLNSDGTVKADVLITDGAGGFTGILDDGDLFGNSVTHLGNLLNPSFPASVATLAIGAKGDDDGGSNLGAVWLLAIQANGNVLGHVKINNATAGFVGALTGGEFFGTSLGSIGDIDLDGIPDLASGYTQTSAGTDPGFFIIRLNADGTVKSYREIGEGMGGYPDPIENNDYWAWSMVGQGGDVIFTGNPGDGGVRRGTLSRLEINSTGLVTSAEEISSDRGAPISLSDYEFYGASVASIGDFNSDGVDDVVLGAPFNDFEGEDKGSVWVQFMQDDGTVLSDRRITSDFVGITEVDVIENLPNDSQFGSSVAGLGNLDGLSGLDIAVGAPRDDELGNGRGSVWTLFLTPTATVSDYRKIDGPLLDNSDFFGASLSNIGDWNADSVPDLLVGATGDDDGGSNRGAVWITYLNADGTAASYQKISDTAGGFSGTLADFDAFGSASATIGMLNGDAIPDLVVGASGDDDGGAGRGAIWIFFMNADGTVASEAKISSTSGGLNQSLGFNAGFGSAIAAPGDLDSDGVPDLIVGAPGESNGLGLNFGAVFVLLMNADGTVKASARISGNSGGLSHSLTADQFGSALASLIPSPGFLASDAKVIAGAPAGNDGGRERGGAYVFELDIIPLAVELSHFSARIANGSMVLQWSTLSEINNAGFAIEHSEDSEYFREIAWLDGAGNSSDLQNYTYNVDTIFDGKQYFRLKQIDYDGSFQYSEIIELNEIPNGLLSLGSVYPNPATANGKFVLSSKDRQDISISIFDVLGKKLMTIFEGQVEEEQKTMFSFSTETLSNGVYHIRLEGDQLQITRPLVISR